MRGTHFRPGIVLALVLICAAAGCSKLDFKSRRSDDLSLPSPDETWVTIYKERFDNPPLPLPMSLVRQSTELTREFFDTPTYTVKWVQLSGQSFSDLREEGDNPMECSIKNDRIKIKCPSTRVIRAGGKIAGDLDITMRLSHPLRDRRWAMALGGPRFEEGYCLLCDRAELRLTKFNLDNILDAADIFSIPSTEKTVIRFLKEGGRISVYVNGDRKLDYNDFLPPLSPDFHYFAVGCSESALEIEELEINQKRLTNENPVSLKLTDDYWKGYAMVFLDDYNHLQTLIPEKDRARMEMMKLQAAASVGAFASLEHAPERYPDLPPAFTSFMRFAAALRKDDTYPIESLAAGPWPVDRNLMLNLRAILQFEIDRAKHLQNPSRVERLYRIAPILLKSDPDILCPMLGGRAVELANEGQKEKCGEILEMMDANPPREKRTQAYAVVCRSNAARQFNDTAEFERLLDAAGRQMAGVPYCLSWLNMMKGEWMKSTGDTERARMWFDKVIRDFPNELDPWLWAHYQNATLMPVAQFRRAVPELRRIAAGFEQYQRQSDAIQTILRRAESSRERAARQAEIFDRAGIRSIRVSSQEEGLDGPEALVDGSLHTRWGSEHGIDPSWIIIEFKDLRDLNGVKIFWETASAREYELLISTDGQSWEPVASENAGKESDMRIFSFARKKTRYLKILMKTRATKWGCSIWEVVCF